MPSDKLKAKILDQVLDSIVESQGKLRLRLDNEDCAFCKDGKWRLQFIPECLYFKDEGTARWIYEELLRRIRIRKLS